MIRLSVLPLLALASASAQISSTNANGWFVYTGDHKFSETSKWGLHLEGQWRRHDLVVNPQQLLLRPGINFEINKYIEIGGGYAYAPTYRYGRYPLPASFTEHRVFQNFIVRNKVGKVSLQNRFRFEQRFLGPRYGYENRSRHLIRATIPLNGAYYVTAYNEIFIPTKPERYPTFQDQDRIAGLVGKKLNGHWRAEAGYMYHPLWQRNGRIREDNHALLVMLWSDQPLRRKK
jgi:hypothetical protein